MLNDPPSELSLQSEAADSRTIASALGAGGRISKFPTAGPQY